MATRRHRLATETSTRFRLRMEAARDGDLTGAIDYLPLGLPVTTVSSGSTRVDGLSPCRRRAVVGQRAYLSTLIFQPVGQMLFGGGDPS
jgi:hypothetical protein